MIEIVAKAEQLKTDVSRNLNNLSPAVRMVAGESLGPVLAMAELMVDMAKEIEELKHGGSNR